MLAEAVISSVLRRSQVCQLRSSTLKSPELGTRREHGVRSDFSGAATVTRGPCLSRKGRLEALATTGVGANVKRMTHAPKATVSELNEHLAAINYARGGIADLAPGRDLVGELIAERPAETLGEEHRATQQRV